MDAALPPLNTSFRSTESFSLRPPPIPTRPLRTCLLVALDNIHGGAGDKPVRAREPLLDINQTLSGKPRNMLFMVYY